MAKGAEVDNFGDGGDSEDETVKKLTLTSKNLNKTISYLIPDAKQAFTQLRQAFIKAPIFQHFNPKCHIRVETNTLCYAIGAVLSQLTLDNLGQWHLVAFYSQKMILGKTWYKTHNSELLAIVKAFKTWRHYLKGCKHEVFVLINQTNLRRFIDIKSLSSRQVYWAQKLFRYYFRIDYHQSKANESANAVSRFLQKNKDEKEKLWAKNTQILHPLQSLLTNATLSGLSILTSLLPPYQVIICGTHAFSQLRRLWNLLGIKLINERLYLASIGSMRPRLQELQKTDSEAQKLRHQGQEDYKEVDGVLHH